MSDIRIILYSVKGSGFDAAGVGIVGTILNIFRVLQVSAFGLDDVEQELTRL